MGRSENSANEPVSNNVRNNTTDNEKIISNAAPLTAEQLDMEAINRDRKIADIDSRIKAKQAELLELEDKNKNYKIDMVVKLEALYAKKQKSEEDKLNVNLVEKRAELDNLEKEFKDKHDSLDKPYKEKLDKLTEVYDIREQNLDDIIKLKSEEADNITQIVASGISTYANEISTLSNSCNVLSFAIEKGLENSKEDFARATEGLSSLCNTLKENADGSIKSQLEIKIKSVQNVTDSYEKTLISIDEYIKNEFNKLFSKLESRKNDINNDMSRLQQDTYDNQSKLLSEQYNTLKIAIDKQTDSVNERERLIVGREIAVGDAECKNKKMELLLDSQAESKIKIMHEELISDNKYLTKLLETTDARLAKIKVDYDKKRVEYDNVKGIDITDLRAENKKLKEKNEELGENIVYDYEQKDMLHKVRNYDKIETEKNNLLLENEIITNELEDLKGKKAQYNTAISLRMLEEKALELNSKEIAELHRILEKTESTEERAKTITSGDYVHRHSSDKVDESAWLADVIKKIAECGYVFSERLVKAFHTCLKTQKMSPIMVLAGVSGTGKSELPKLYSRIGGLDFLATAVNPDWDSPASMYGYYNPLEKKFNAKPLIRKMYQAQKYDMPSSNMHTFLLDEMNLAHVEQYFSDMLSKLEENRTMSDREVRGIDIELGAGVEPLHVKLTRNMLWIGTMNEDETTKALSDKVQDRSNIIVFPRPKELVSKEMKPVPKGNALAYHNWTSWIKGGYENKAVIVKIAEYKNIIEQINKALDSAGRALGHRVWQSIETYIYNHPDVIAAVKNTDDDKLIASMDSAFADVVAFKVMPKLKGIELDDNKIKKNCLDEIGKIIDNGCLKELKVDYALARENPYNVFKWTTGEFLTVISKPEGKDND